MKEIKIIPCLDVKDGRVVKRVNFINLRDARDPVEAAEAYCREGADGTKAGYDLEMTQAVKYLYLRPSDTSRRRGYR